MTDIVAAAPEKPRGKKGLLIPLVATLVLGGAGFASSYLGFWSPSGMLSGPEEPVQSTEHMSVEFIDIRFCDLPGVMQHFNVPASTFDEEAIATGQLFDGSSRTRSLKEPSRVFVMRSPSVWGVQRIFR